MPATLTSARRNYRLSALIARRAVREARAARNRGTAAIASVVIAHQVANATTSRRAVPEMLTEQDIASEALAVLNPGAFTTDLSAIADMLAEVDRRAGTLLDQTVASAYTDAAFDRLVESIVQDAARAAEQAAVAVRPNIAHVRFVNLPCCSRCAVLAGRVYRWSSSFLRHPGCDCSMIPTTVASPLVQDPDELVRIGQVRGLSQADLQAHRDGADLGRLVNVRQSKAGLLESGQALMRAGRPTPVAIYREAGDDRDRALDLLARHGYIR